MRAIPENGLKNFLKDSIARGGPAQQHFRKKASTNKNNIISTRILMRLKMVEKAEKISTAYYRENWRSVKGTWPTQGFQQDNTFVRCPLTVSSSLPQKKTQFFYQN
jgi:hypothetical protein